MTVQEQVIQELADLDASQLGQVVKYVALLKSQRRVLSPPSEWAVAYAEAAEEDRELSEQGLSDYVTGLRREDVE